MRMVTVDCNPAKFFDQFYTQDSVAEQCLSKTINVCKTALGYRLKSTQFLEPSAGAGAFLRALNRQACTLAYACDIDPHDPIIQPCDFLEANLYEVLPKRNQLVALGNPPFGKRAQLAIRFINRAFLYADTVAFILPLQFQKYSAQSKIIPAARLVYDEPLPTNSFLYDSKEYNVRCCFQIWTRRPGGQDLRMRSAPQITHPDFEMWQYNNTRGTEKYFNKAVYGWDFAVPRQGYKDYTLKETDPTKLDRHTQWIFFKAHTRAAYDNLIRLDFIKLSHKNTSTPGFGKADVVAEYRARFESCQDTIYASTCIHQPNYRIQTFQQGDPRPSLAGAFSGNPSTL